MQSGEHDPSVSDRPDQPELVERIYAERDLNGSTVNYVNDLIIYYNSLTSHRANMLQLQRHARMIVDPKDADKDIGHETDAFYWGEVLGYSACESLLGVDWKKRCWKSLHRAQTQYYQGAWDNLKGTQESRMEAIGVDIQGKLELMSNKIPLDLTDMIDSMAKDLHTDPTMQEYVSLGFKHVLVSALGFHDNAEDVSSETLAIRHTANAILYQNGYLPLEQEPRFVRSEFTHYAMLDIFYESLTELNIYEKPEDEETYLEQLQTLTSAVNTKFIEHRGIHLGDEYRFSGSVLAVAYSYENPSEVSTFMVNEGAVVEGTMQPIYVLEGPSETMIEILQNNPNSHSEQLEKHINPYCALIELGSAVIQEPDGTVHQVPEYERLFVVLNNEQMHMERFVIQ